MPEVGGPRWELGSLLEHLRVDPVDGPGDPCPWMEHPAVLVGSGRCALLLAISAGGYSRLWVPSYLCQEVVSAAAASVDLQLYADSPTDPAPDLAGLALTPGDAILVVNYFGLRARSARPPLGVGVIEDHTHDLGSPWAMSSTADYCTASLRKLLPLADGGALWSSTRPMPAPPPLRAELVDGASRKFWGMLLKRQYLDGADVDKPTFRALLAAGEGALFHGTPSAMTERSRRSLPTFPLARWRARRRASFDAFVAAFGDQETARVHRPHSPDAVPFSGLVELDTAAHRDEFLAAVCARRVYPAKLWPLDAPVLPGTPPEHQDLSRRLLSFPLDARYGPEDLEQAGRIAAESI